MFKTRKNVQTKTKRKKPPLLAMWGMVSAGTAVIFVLLLTPWNFIPVQVTEDVIVIANVDYGCVGESQYGVSVVVPECGAQVGDSVCNVLRTFNETEWVL